ncbi:amidohydrolase family protein [Mesorhizobium waimense]|nr:amidohydrolase family protein [Mesorhizobium waimense]
MLDAFNHYLPRPVLDRIESLAPTFPILPFFERLPALWNLDVRLPMMDEVEGYRQIICLSNPPLELIGSRQDGIDLASFVNDELAETCRRNPHHFPAFVASVSMADPEAAVAEAGRAVRDLGAVGIQVFTNVAGRPLSDAAYLPLFEAMAAHDLPILIHPMRSAAFSDYASEDASQNEVWFTFGWPYETSACVTRLIYSGLFDKLPGLKIVTHHMGGMIPYFAEKIALGFSQIFLGTLERNPVGERAGLKRPPIDYFRMLYADTAVNGSAAAAACGHAFFGTDRCLFATDAPFDPVDGRHLLSGTIAAIRGLDLDEAARAKIFEGNARALFRLEVGR